MRPLGKVRQRDPASFASVIQLTTSFARNVVDVEAL
jgi:hypothetical protein